MLYIILKLMALVYPLPKISKIFYIQYRHCLYQLRVYAYVRFERNFKWIN